MLIVIERRDCPVCEIIRRNLPDSGVAFLPAVPLRFEAEPQELKRNFEAGRLRFDLRGGLAPDLRPAPQEAVGLYRRETEPHPKAEADGRGFDTTA